MIQLDKEAFRKMALARRKALSKDQVCRYSKSICRKVELYLHGNIAMYHAYGNEVDLSYITAFKDINEIAFPKTYADYTIRFFKEQNNTRYEKSSFGIMEPTSREEMLAKNIDVMLIPLVAFDEQCHRMGHGKGFYDRYLSKYTGLRIGIAYECQKFPDIPIRTHDESLDIIITETNTYKHK